MRCTGSPRQPVADEARDVEGGVGGEELQRLADERQAHGARREAAAAARVPPPVHRVQQQQQHEEHQRGEAGEPHVRAHRRRRGGELCLLRSRVGKLPHGHCTGNLRARGCQLG